MAETAADVKVSQASDALGLAARLLADIVIGRCDGCDELGPDHVALMRAALAAVIRARDDIDVR